MEDQPFFALQQSVGDESDAGLGVDFFDVGRLVGETGEIAVFPLVDLIESDGEIAAALVAGSEGPVIGDAGDLLGDDPDDLAGTEREDGGTAHFGSEFGIDFQGVRSDAADGSADAGQCFRFAVRDDHEDTLSDGGQFVVGGEFEGGEVRVFRVQADQIETDRSAEFRFERDGVSFEIGEREISVFGDPWCGGEDLRFSVLGGGEGDAGFTVDAFEDGDPAGAFREQFGFPLAGIRTVVCQGRG